MSISYIPRVTQLDAVQLDEQVEELLKQQLLQVTKFFGPGIFQPFLPELELLLRTWIFKYSLIDKKCTFGQEMLSLKYKDDNFTQTKLYWYYGYTIALKYFKDRAIYSFTSNAKLQNIIHKLEIFQLVGDIINFLKFIQSGKYPILIDFILGLKLTADKITREDLTDFTWTRELLWHNFIELVGTVMSLMNILGVKRRLSNILKFVWWRQQTSGKAAVATMTVHSVCACCSNRPIIPHTMGCSHIFCYYCLMANKTADQDYACPKCYYNGREITRFVM